MSARRMIGVALLVVGLVWAGWWGIAAVGPIAEMYGSVAADPMGDGGENSDEMVRRVLVRVGLSGAGVALLLVGGVVAAIPKKKRRLRAAR